jgi:iron complex outermembrane recepter protein
MNSTVYKKPLSRTNGSPGRAFCPGLRLQIVILYVLFSTNLYSQPGKSLSAKELKELSVEELMNLEVLLVSRSPQKLTQASSSVQVITGMDIRNSGASNVAEALRLVTNLQVAQQRSNSWIIGSRGFNTIFANKLLVMIDGRTVYTPLFAGVLWDQQNLLLEDIEKIEVVSGPGGALWGANAVNGIINIVTKKTADTQGLYASVQIGSFVRDQAALRWGGKIGKKANYRVYGQHFSRASTEQPNGEKFQDSWRMTQGGFRIDWSGDASDTYTVQGDLYGGTVKTTGSNSDMKGQNLLARWRHTVSEKAEWSLQLYYDSYYKSDAPGSSSDEMKTVDADFQYRFPLGKSHSVMVGAGYRRVWDHFISSSAVAILPARKNLDLVNGFIRDEISVSEKLTLAIGTKLLHNVYTGVEFQPGLRTSYAFNRKNHLWAAASRSVRTPSRIDVDYFSPAEPQPPTAFSVTGGPQFESEKLFAYELGYRMVPDSKSTVSLSAFYNNYKDVYSLEAFPGTLHYEIRNGSRAKSRGLELAGTYQLLQNWRVRAGYTFFDMDLTSTSATAIDPAYLANDVRHQALLHSMAELPFGFHIDVIGRYLDYISATLATAKVPAYVTLDTRLAYTFKFAEFSVVGQNLASKRHNEFDVLRIPRSIYAKLAIRF